MDGSQPLTPAPFSTVSRPTFPHFVYGADWPDWQRNLYPVTYQTRREDVEHRLDVQRAEVARARKQMFLAMRRGDLAGVRAYRAQLDAHETYVRNCLTQLRLIDAAASFTPHLALKAEPNERRRDYCGRGA